MENNLLCVLFIFTAIYFLCDVFNKSAFEYLKKNIGHKDFYIVFLLNEYVVSVDTLS